MSEGIGDSNLTAFTGWPCKPVCQVCGSELEPAAAPLCKKCQENKEIADNMRDYWKYVESGADK